MIIITCDESVTSKLDRILCAGLKRLPYMYAAHDHSCALLRQGIYQSVLTIGKGATSLENVPWRTSKPSRSVCAESTADIDAASVTSQSRLYIDNNYYYNL